MKELFPFSRGRLVATTLAGSWRTRPEASVDLSPVQLDEVTPLLYGSGAGALGWWRIQHTELCKTASAEVLHQAYRLQVLQSGIHEEKIIKVFRLLKSHSLEGLLIKGWAAAGMYPHRGLRPYGDIDLVVHPKDHAEAVRILQQTEVRDCWVDLHEGVDELNDRSIGSLFERAREVAVQNESIRVPCAEDQLALLSIHLLKHGAWRPLWLCDIGVALESLTSDFDWEMCLGTNRKRRGWITAAIGLAHALLCASLELVPHHVKTAPLPDWLLDNVLKQWEHPFAVNQPPMSHPAPMSTVWRHPAQWAKALRDRWPDPIMATVSVNGAFNSCPRFPYQLANCAARSARFLQANPFRNWQTN